METAERALTSIQTPRLLITGLGAKHFISMVVLGLLYEAKRRRLAVTGAEIGPRLINATHYRRICGRLIHTLDPWLLSKEQLVHSFARLSSGTELAVIEGTAGLYDNHGNDCDCRTDAEVAAALGAPILLAINAAGWGESIAALIHGFRDFHPHCSVEGVIAFGLEDEAHAERIGKTISQIEGITYFGGIPGLSKGDEASRRDNPGLLTRSVVVGAADLVAKHLDLDRLFGRFAATATPIEVPSEIVRGAKRQCRIAVADDAAFHLTIQDNLDLLRRAGAELVAFSPLADPQIPERCSALYFPDGPIHLYLKDLEQNQRLYQSLQEFIAQNGVLYAEGAASAYLCRNVRVSGGAQIRGVGIVPGDATAFLESANVASFDYVEAYATAESVLGPAGETTRALRDKRWAFRFESKISSCMEVYDRVALLHPRDETLPPAQAGFQPSSKSILSPLLMHWGSNPQFASRFIMSAI